MRIFNLDNSAVYPERIKNARYRVLCTTAGLLASNFAMASAAEADPASLTRTVSLLGLAVSTLIIAVPIIAEVQDIRRDDREFNTELERLYAEFDSE